MLLPILAATNATAREELRFTDARVLPAIGLELRVMANSHEQPLHTLEQFTYVVTSGTSEPQRVEMFDPQAKWAAEQHAAQWQDPYGNDLIVAVVRCPPPAPFRREHVAPDEYTEIRAPDAAPEAWTPAMLAQWVAAFSGAGPVRANRPADRPARLSDLVEFSFDGTGSNRLAYAFRLNPQAIGQRNASPGWFYAGFSLAPGIDSDRAQRAVRTRFLQYLGSPANSSPAARAAPLQLDPDPVGPASPPSAERQASRDQAAQSIANLDDWWLLESDNYILLTNMKTGTRNTARQLLSDLETLRHAYTRLAPARVPITAVSVIRMPAQDADYLQYVGPALVWSAGIWLPSRRELVIRSLELMTTQQRREQLRSTTFHEGFHQYLHYALDQASTSPWFNEGQAELFESVDVGKRDVRFRDDPVKVTLLDSLLERRTPLLKTLLALDYDAFYGANELERAHHYTVAWAFAYYLRCGVPSERRSPYAGLMDAYLDAVWTLRDANKASAQVFGNVDMEALDRDFRDFWRSPSRRKVAGRMEIDR